jgi:hypothetical protein
MGDRSYITTQGDYFDVIALKMYGMRRGRELLCNRLMEADWALRNVMIFSAGIKLRIPDVDPVEEVQLVPWKRARLELVPGQSVIGAEPVPTRATRWYTGWMDPGWPFDVQIGDFFLNSISGDVFRYEN